MVEALITVDQEAEGKTGTRGLQRPASSDLLLGAKPHLLPDLRSLKIVPPTKEQTFKL